MNACNRADEIERRIRSALQTTEIAVTDESHLHVGHEGARDGRGHFAVRVVSPAFAGQRPLERHRAVYAALGAFMSSDIHALRIDARSPDEALSGN